MGAAELARPVADPDHVARGRVIVAGGRIEPRHRLFVAEQQRFVRGVEVRRPEFRMRFGVEADRAHEAERLGDAVGDLLIAFGLRAIVDEAEHPPMGVLEIGVAAGGEGPQQVEGRRRLAIGFQLPARIGLARLRGEFDVVDDVAAISRQRDAIDRLEIRGARLGELAGDAADLDDRRGGGERHHDRHLQEHPEEIADIVGRVLAEALGAVAALQQERLACGRLAKRAFEFARFAREHQRRIAGKLPLSLGQRRAVLVDRRLLDRLRAPAVRGPTLVRHHPCLFQAARRRFSTGRRAIYSPKLEADMPIFEAASSFYGSRRGIPASRAGLWCETMPNQPAQARFPLDRRLPP